MPALRAEVMWPDGLKGPAVHSGHLWGLLAWMLLGGVQLGTEQLLFTRLGD